MIPKKTMHFVWYAVLFTAITLVTEKLVGGLTGGMKKGAGKALGL